MSQLTVKINFRTNIVARVFPRCSQ